MNTETGRNLDREAPPGPPTNLDLPVPTLELDFSVKADLNSKVSVGKTPFGRKNWIGIVGGTWHATWGGGKIMSGGQDYQTVTDSLATKVETHYLLETGDPSPAYITVKTSGWRTGDSEVLEALFDPDRADAVSPRDYSFRLYINLETGDERYAFVNERMWVASGARLGRQVIYDAYRIS